MKLYKYILLQSKAILWPFPSRATGKFYYRKYLGENVLERFRQTYIDVLRKWEDCIHLDLQDFLKISAGGGLEL